MLFVFEGIDGSGKDTIMSGVYENLVRLDIPVYVTRQPSLAGKEKLIKSSEYPLQSLLILAEDYQKVVLEEILPKLLTKPNTVILCSRWFPITAFAYQVAQGCYFDQVLSIVSSVYPLRPDGVFYINVPLEMALHRIARRGISDRLDVRSKEFYEKVVDGYDIYKKINLRSKFNMVDIDNQGSPLVAIEKCTQSILGKIK